MADRRLFDSSSMTQPPAPEIDAMTCTVENVASDEPVQMSQGFVRCTPYEPTAVRMMVGDQVIWLQPDGPPEIVASPAKTGGAL
ncbi:hypothetical protein ACIPUD_15910 [Bradyrhizobium sp. CAR08]